VIYLDNAATSHPKAPGVPDAVARCLEAGFGSPGRASHPLALGADRILFEVREACAALLGLTGPERLVFTRNATEALNLAIVGSVPPGGRVAVTSLEHNAVMRPLRHLEATLGVEVDVIPFDPCGRPDPEGLGWALALGPDLVVMTTASNVTGALTPAEEIADRCGRLGIPFCADASQTAGHFPLPGPCRFVAFPGHKGLLGPGGTGALHLGPGADPAPLILGGTGSESEREVQPRLLPDRFESGTPNVPGLAGLLEAIRFLEREGVGAVQARVSARCVDLALGLQALPGVTVIGPGPGEARAPVVSITLGERDLGEVALELDRREICARAGLHCAPAAHRSAGTFEGGGTLRFSPGFATTDADIRGTLEAMEEILK
jgi:cysteine desulfurase family protein